MACRWSECYLVLGEDVLLAVASRSEGILRAAHDAMLARPVLQTGLPKQLRVHIADVMTR